MKMPNEKNREGNGIRFMVKSSSVVAIIFFSCEPYFSLTVVLTFSELSGVSM